MSRLFFIIYLVSTCITAQSPAEDRVRFNSAVDWLNTKLDYLYYDDFNGNWWNNTFYMDENKVVTIKQISSKTRQTANFKNKNYTVRKFSIEDINPYTLEIKDVDESMGRFVKGQLLEIHTFSDEKKIHKVINRRQATSTSFLHLSFPKVLTDTLVNYPELVKEKLFDAVVSATKVYYKNPEANRALIFSIMSGSFQSDSGNRLTTARIFDNVLSLDQEELISYFGYDAQQDLFYLNQISPTGVRTDFYQMKEDSLLLLVNTADPEQTIEFETLNSFRIHDRWYYRQ